MGLLKRIGTALVRAESPKPILGPKIAKFKSGEWELEIKHAGVFENFQFGIAQQGHPRASKITLKGPGVLISIEKAPNIFGDLGPINLTDPDQIFKYLICRVINEHNIQLSMEFLVQLCQKENLVEGSYSQAMC